MKASEPHPVRWTSEEYYRLSEANYFLERRVELIDGEILVKPAQTEAHCAAIALTHDALREAFGPDFWVRLRGSLDLSPVSVLDPDVAVVAGSVRTHKGNANPTSALLVVEASDEGTLDYDRRRKARVICRCWRC
jgi:Uma2 family endonuclease